MSNYFNAPTVVAVAIGAAATLLVIRRFRSSARPAVPPAPPAPEPTPDRAITVTELASFNGTGGRPVYVAVFGDVFEVDPKFYGPSSPYHVFAGKDATLPLARMDLSGANANAADWDAQLSAEERGVAGDWHKKFQGKYPQMGRVAFA